jgi:hypothetical protein
MRPGGSKHPSWKGSKYVSGNYYWMLKRNAEIRGLEYSVTNE